MVRLMAMSSTAVILLFYRTLFGARVATSIRDLIELAQDVLRCAFTVCSLITACSATSQLLGP
jgi:hypothetical protein